MLEVEVITNDDQQLNGSTAEQVGFTTVIPSEKIYVLSLKARKVLSSSS